MKFKFAIALLLSLVVLSPIASSEDGHGYRIVSEKFTSTPGANGYLLSVSPDKKLNVTTENEVKAYAYAPNQLGCPQTFTKVMGYHEVTMRNETDKMMRFKYIYSLAIEDASNYFERNIELDPKGYYHDTSEDYLAFQRPSVEKRYDILVDTNITGDGIDSSSHTGYLNLWFRLCK